MASCVTLFCLQPGDRRWQPSRQGTRQGTSHTRNSLARLTTCPSTHPTRNAPPARQGEGPNTAGACRSRTQSHDPQLRPAQLRGGIEHPPPPLTCRTEQGVRPVARRHQPARASRGVQPPDHSRPRRAPSLAPDRRTLPRKGVGRRPFHRRDVPLVALIGDRYNGSVTDPFAPSPDGQLTRPPASVPTGRRRRTKESDGGMFAAFAAFWCTQMLVFQPVSQLLPEYEHVVTALTGLLAAAAAYPLAIWWLKRLPCQTHPTGRQ
ncbi:hypothetical protein QFZ22_000740 [Streptomyces canus]|uniref:Uncharacterized protein n=1 Tax=Streptomyces canus TaxID=58343 RepID=A0AAW8F5W2_9ACTN|nr:hypothetical protein [Streptomyces canus]